MWRISLFSLIVFVMVLTASAGLADTTGAPAGQEDAGGQPSVGVPNPASEYCVNQGGELEIRDEADGQAGYCIFADGSECEEWAFFRGECAPASGQAAQETERITARMLVEPDALAGPRPSHLQWSPQGATLAYVAPQDGQEVLWLYEAETRLKQVLLDPTGHDDIIISSAQWSPQGDTLLLRGQEALWLVDVETGDLTSLAEDGTKTAVAFSPTGELVSYVQDNDLFTVRIADGEIQQLTHDGGDSVSNGTHFNGTLDWVYGEEFATRVAQPAYAWSPDGEWLFYLRLDDEGVQQHPITDYRTIPPTVSTIRYPTAGSPNPQASLHLIGFENGEPGEPFRLPEDAEYILPFFTWDPASGEVFYLAENREHTELRLEAWNPVAGTSRTVIQETSADWVNEFLYAAPVFLGDDGQFLWLSERDGFMHIYLYARDGQLIRQVTEGEWLVDSLPWDLLTPGKPVHVDPTGSWAYFSSTQVSPLERHLYRLNIDSGEMEQLSREAGFHSAGLSGDGQYLVEQFSSVETPPVIVIRKADGSEMSVLGRSAGPSLDLPQVSREFLTVKAHDSVDLYAQIVKPQDFDPGKKYPVVIHWYGGPTLQLVTNRYGTDNIFNHIERDVIYTQEGFIVWRLDNRGSFGRGHAFEAPIAGHMGPAALDDQLAGVEYLKTLPYVDAERIGVDGKSFGGFLALYALIHEPDTFAAAVAGSGPTDWRTYDTVYTERYMSTPEQNPDGYAATELVSRVDQLQVRPLIIHGLADTNVHLQNSVNVMEAMMKIDKPFEFLPLPYSDHHYGGDGFVYVLAEGARYFVEQLQPGSAPPQTYQPLDAAACSDVAEALQETFTLDVTTEQVAFDDYVSGETGAGCQVTAEGSGYDFGSLPEASAILGALLEARGWEEDMQYQADGPTATATAYRLDDALCLVDINWQPADGADCPADQPISACELAPDQQLYTATVNCAQLLGGSESPAGGQTQSGLANPASVYCTDQGGELEIRDEADGQAGYCIFPDGSECEEWAFFKGECVPSEQEDSATADQEPAASPSGYSTTADSMGSEVTTTISDDWVPLEEAVDDLEPKQVWQNFYDLTQVPRPSHHEEKVGEFLVGFGQGLGLETIQDDVGNVIIRKPAAPGLENRQGVILQAHMDMVPQKTDDKVHDFTKDPIEAYVVGDWVTADGTTLGADDGIGVAIAMTILQSNDLDAGPIEALFTVNEEDGLDGAVGLQPGVLQGDILINMDWETEGSYCIGSAGGEAGDIDITYDEVAVPAGMTAYELQVQGLKGGHSGVDINRGRGHATKILVRLLKKASLENGLRLATLEGGTARNAIPQEASAVVTVPESQSEQFLESVQAFEGIVKSELSAVEPDLTVGATAVDLPTKVMGTLFQRDLIDALYGTPQGVMRMSDAVPGLVETSTNMGIVQAQEGELKVTHYLRSSVATSMDDLDQMIASVWDLAGIGVDFSGRYPGWQPDPDEPILALMKEVYKDLYGEEAGVEAVHAGLECSIIGAKYPNMEIVSIGPTLLDVHTPNEKLLIASVHKLTDLLQETLIRIPEK